MCKNKTTKMRNYLSIISKVAILCENCNYQGFMQQKKQNLMKMNDYDVIL